MPPIHPVIHPGRANAYTGSPLDRAAHLRENAGWLTQALAAPGSLWAPVWRSRNLILDVADGAPQAALLTGAALDAVRPALDCPWALLGLWHDRTPLFAIDLSAADDPLPLLPPAAGAFTDLRAVAGSLPPDEAALLAHARGLLHWRARHRFCANCGQPVVPRHAGNATVCPACETQHFPRTDPAVIMLVTSGDRALLGHSSRFPTTTMYSTLAGFVEPGESLEEAVAREVFEESGIRVADVTYHSSQPWPFPASIMLGFYARALNQDIVIDPVELTDAQWFSRAEIAQALMAPGLTKLEGARLSVPGHDSIARRLMEDWVCAP